MDTTSREVVSDILGIQTRNKRGRYLGLPSLIGRIKREIDIGIYKG